MNSSVKGCRFLAAPCLLIDSGPTAQRQHRPQQAGPFYINHQLREGLQRLATGQSDGDIFSIESPFYQMALACIKLTQDETSQYAFPRQ